MYYIYDKTSVQSVLEQLNAKKYIKQNGKLYEFSIDHNALVLNIYDDGSPPSLIETLTLEKNAKGEFSICEDEQKVIHIVAANKKYDLLYMRFDGENLKKEIIYAFNNNFLIPTTPVIQVTDGLVVVALEFLTAAMPKEWSLRVYTKKKTIYGNII